MSDYNDQQNLLRRLDRLEAHNRQLRYAILATFALFTISCLGKKTTFSTGNIEAEGFVLRGSGGRLYAALGLIANDYPALVFYDAERNPRVQLAVSPDGIPTLFLFSHDRAPLAFLGVKEDGLPELALYAAESEPRAAFLLDPGGLPGLVLYDHDHRRRIDLSVDSNRLPHFTLFDNQNDFPRFLVGLLPDGTSHLSLLDSSGKPRAALGLHDDGSPVFRLADVEGQSRAELSTTANGDARLGFANKTGKLIWSAP